jgi:hypothetical protein
MVPIKPIDNAPQNIVATLFRLLELRIVSIAQSVRKHQLEKLRVITGKTHISIARRNKPRHSLRLVLDISEHLSSMTFVADGGNSGQQSAQSTSGLYGSRRHAPQWIALPVFGWSGVTGDLRSAHFVSLHAMQALPMLALWLGRQGKIGSVGTIRLASAGYAILTLAIFGQALLGLPLIPLG